MKEGWMKNDECWRMNVEGWMLKDEGWMLKDEWWRMMISSCWGVSVTDGQMNERTDIGECRVAFATENGFSASFLEIRYWAPTGLYGHLKLRNVF